MHLEFNSHEIHLLHSSSLECSFLIWISLSNDNYICIIVFFFQIEFFSSLSLSLQLFSTYLYAIIEYYNDSIYKKKIKIWTKNNYFHSFFLFQIKFKAFWAIKHTKTTSNCFRRMAFHCWLELVMLSTTWVWLIWQKMLIG